MSESTTEHKTTASRKRGASSSDPRSLTTSPSEVRPHDGTFVCPECGKSFSRPQALGAHRSRTHGVAGTSKAARSASGRRGAATTRTARARAASGRRSTESSDQVGRKQSSPPDGGQVDRDKLLATLFPNGVPAKVSVIEALTPWLDEAERLSRMR